ncbi:MAG: tRNA (adenosine(37)-N6)-threonylcarbamoyltransferase complex dimerization subunit type 1 TsaB [Deltaproteobacteria bacterium]|nr:tRNA (adenosine(37)-N6)-threonylcarbamoyltransferase complex dimerization subunit type 1 TsaB [Deltaproteobacteria bacterium]MCL5276503.1 tRNA (adenosine(37)-N6)-threonylcarbamoyltransferase complex dimerization subunit type 1 TsaB [Deltaproteobacteria bacterium]
MLRLIIDTALGYMGIGVATDAGVLASAVVASPVTITTLGAKTVDFLLRASGHDRKELLEVAVSAGPGTFTSLRAGISLAKGIGMGLDVPIVPVSTLDAMADTVRQGDGYLAAAIDGKNDNIYLAVYGLRPGAAEKVVPDTLIKAVGAAAGCPKVLRQHPVRLIGFGVERYKGFLTGICTRIETWDRLEPDRMIGSLNRIASQRLYSAVPCPAVTFAPVYLRLPDVNKKNGRPGLL